MALESTYLRPTLRQGTRSSRCVSYDVPDVVLTVFVKAGFFLSLVYAIGHWFIKMSILFLYMRIFTTRMRWFNIIIYVCIAYVSGWTLGLGITIVTQWSAIFAPSHSPTLTRLAAALSVTSGSSITSLWTRLQLGYALSTRTPPRSPQALSIQSPISRS